MKKSLKNYFIENYGIQGGFAGGVMAADIMSAQITTPCKEKIWTTLGSEFGKDKGKKAIVVQALCGLKSDG